MKQSELAKRMGFSTRNGLLYLTGLLIQLPEADKVAQNYGFLCAERIVKAMEGK